MRCVGCGRVIGIGDLFIRDRASGFVGEANASPDTDRLIAEIFGGNGDEVVFCADCTEPGGRYALEVYDGDDEEDA